MLTRAVSCLSPEDEGAFSDSFIELSSKKKARVRRSSSRREGEHASVSEHSGRSHTFPSHPPPPLLPLHTLFSSCYSHSHSCPLILQMKTLLKLQRAAELSDQHVVVVVVVVVVPGPEQVF